MVVAILVHGAAWVDRVEGHVIGEQVSYLPRWEIGEVLADASLFRWQPTAQALEAGAAAATSATNDGVGTTSTAAHPQARDCLVLSQNTQGRVAGHPSSVRQAGSVPLGDVFQFACVPPDARSLAVTGQGIEGRIHQMCGDHSYCGDEPSEVLLVLECQVGACCDVIAISSVPAAVPI